LSLAAEAKHLLGVPYGKIAHFFQKAFGLRVNRSTLARADQRVAQAHHSSYAQIQQVVQASPATHVDETGWKVAGRLAWLWTAATRQATLYLIHRRRGHEVVEDLLGPAYPGKLICDSFLAYEALDYPQQKCLQHLIRRGLELEAIKLGRAKKFGQAVAHLLRQAIHLRHRFQVGEHSVRGYAIACGRVEAACNRLLIGRLVDEDNVRLFNLLHRQRHRLFAFLYDEDLEPTNALAEQALRPAVAIRKMSACNRSWRGAHVHTILMSVLRTCRQQGQDFLSWTIQRLRSSIAAQPLWLTSLVPPGL
jgi:transposase